MSTSLVTSLVTHTAELLSLQNEWEDLYQDSPSATPVIRWKWIWWWWQHIGVHAAASEHALRIITIRSHTTLVAVLPLFYRKTATFGSNELCLIGTGTEEEDSVFPQYTTMLVRRGEESAAVRELTSLLRTAQVLPWDVLTLGVTQKGSLLHELAHHLNIRSQVITRRRTFLSPRAAIQRGLEEYLGCLQGSKRTVKRVLRDALALGVQLEVANTTTEAEKFLLELMELHQARWIKREHLGAFASLRVRSFHEALCKHLNTGTEIFVARLRIADHTLGVVYGFLQGEKCEAYQSGWDLVERDLRGPSSLKSPGIALHLLSIDYLSKHGIKEYDFLGGEGRYKEVLATYTTPLEELQLIRLNQRTAGALFKRGSRTLARTLFRSVYRSLFCSLFCSLVDSPNSRLRGHSPSRNLSP